MKPDSLTVVLKRRLRAVLDFVWDWKIAAEYLPIALVGLGVEIGIVAAYWISRWDGKTP